MMRAYFSFMLAIFCIALLLSFIHMPYLTSKEKEIKIIKANTLAHHHARFFSHSTIISGEEAALAYLAACAVAKKPPKKDELDKVIKAAIMKEIQENANKEIDKYHIYLWGFPILHPSFLSQISAYVTKNHALPPSLSALSCPLTISLKYALNQTNNSINIFSLSLYNSTTRTRVGITSCSPNYDVCTSFLLPKEMKA